MRRIREDGRERSGNGHMWKRRKRRRWRRRKRSDK